MGLIKCALICALLVLSNLEHITARKSFGGRSHSYPKSGGLSGGGSHHSGGLSGGGHGYPSSGGSHGYPSGGLSGGGHSSGGSHSYPSSGGSHGYPSSGGSHGYPSSGGSHGYPSSSGGLSGSGSANTHHTNNHGYPAGKSVAGNTHTTNIHHHYHYNPPQQIQYSPVRGGPPVSYPVYHGTPPTYVYKYQDSGSKYGTLLAGLALLNLGALGAVAGSSIAHSHSHSNSYKPAPGEICKFGVKKDNGDYEETRIDCQLISSFILQEQAKTNNGPNNTTVTTTTVTNVTTINTTNGVPDPAAGTPAPANQTVPNVLYQMLPNGTLVPVNVTSTNTTTTPVNATDSAAPANTMTSVTTMTTTSNTTITNALDVKGKAVEVTPGMECYVIRVTSSSKMKKAVPCGLLQTYAEKSIKRNSATRHVPTFTMAAVVLAMLFVF